MAKKDEEMLKSQTKFKKEKDVGRVILKESYWLNRIFFLRSLAFIYFVAFLIGLDQNKQLLGSTGLLPVDNYLRLIKAHFPQWQPYSIFVRIPTLLLFVEESQVDYWLDAIAYTGMFLSMFVFVVGASNMVIMTSLWLLYHSLVNVGQRWYSFGKDYRKHMIIINFKMIMVIRKINISQLFYFDCASFQRRSFLAGWESQLLETGFLAIFFCPVFSIKSIPVKTTPSKVVIYGYRWLIFRIMIGASGDFLSYLGLGKIQQGLIKWRGDQCWRDLTCMNYHYQTQPVPNPISYYMHQTPEVFHKIEVLTNHFVELVAPVFIFLPRPFRLFGGCVQVLFQVVLIISGNLSFLNWLTILPSIACFDDEFLKLFFSKSTVQRLESLPKEHFKTWGMHVRKVFDFALACLLITLSVPVIQNLVSSQQAMNTSFDSFRLVNTYGAFGSVTKERTEVIIQGTRNETLIPDEMGGIWQEYEFKCKPGLVTRRPCFISPYHYRLDWLMWFSAFMNYQQNPWLIHLAAKLLANDRNISTLLSHNPFLDGEPPKFIRGEHYRYEFTKIGSEESKTKWWSRKKIGSYFPIVNLKSLKDYLKNNGWRLPVIEKLKE